MGVGAFFLSFLFKSTPKKENKSQTKGLHQCEQFGSDLSHLHTKHCLALDIAQQNPWDTASTVYGSSTLGRLSAFSLGRLRASNHILPPLTLEKGWIPP